MLVDETTGEIIVEKSLQVYEPSFLASVGITLTRTSLEIPDDLSFGDWCKIGEQLSIVEAATHWAIGDWLIYAGKQYGETYTEAGVLTGFAVETLKQDKYVALHVEKWVRIHFLKWAHHKLVAPLEQDQQVYWLNLAQQNHWSVAELRRQMKMQLASEVPPPPPGKYRVIYADPPWQYSNKGLQDYGHAEFHYPTMSIEELCAMGPGIQMLAEDNAALFLWVTSPLLAECFPVIEAWGFKYKTSFVWDKIKHNFGHYNSVRHELLLVCTRGSCTPDIKELFDSVQAIERTDKHSEKPGRFREIIDTLYTHGRRIELFARATTDGWETWGNEPE